MNKHLIAVAFAITSLTSSFASAKPTPTSSKNSVQGEQVLASTKPNKSTPSKQPAFQQPESVVNILTASEDQLQLLPGVGPAKSAIILAHRGKEITSCADLAKVKGVGEKSLAAILPHCCDAPQCETNLDTKLGRDGEPAKSKKGGLLSKLGL